MSNEALIIYGTLMGATTIILVVLMTIAFKPKVFNAAKALNIKPGVYQNISTGDIVEVRSINNNMVYIVCQSGGYNLHYNILERNYRYLGQL